MNSSADDRIPSGHRSVGLWPNDGRTHHRGSVEAVHPDQSLSRSAWRREPEATLDAGIANVGFHAPCAWSTKGWPTAAKERSPSSIDSERPQIPRVSVAGGPLMRDFPFGVFGERKR